MVTPIASDTSESGNFGEFQSREFNPKNSIQSEFNSERLERIQRRTSVCRTRPEDQFREMVKTTG